MAAHAGAAVAGELDEVEGVEDRQSAREVGDEDDARLERPDEDRFAPVEVARDLRSELPDAPGDIGCGEVDLSDPVVRRVVAGLS